ncbi:MAG: hypothetical protein LBR91_03640 [Puniceicoccales bacterium]|nr:hypothetical protein [Puniceicoccales bacterium]
MKSIENDLWQWGCEYGSPRENFEFKLVSDLTWPVGESFAAIGLSKETR